MRTSGLRRWNGRWRVPLFVVACGSAAMALAPARAGAGGDATQAYVATASASSARLTWIVPGQFAVEEVTDSGGPVAQSRLDSGSSESFASLPYPGGTAVAYQGLLAVATGVSSPFAYPFFVQASNPGHPEAELTDPSGTYRLQAGAAGGATSAVARFRPGAPDAVISGGEATTSITTDGGRVSSVAHSLSEAVALGDGALRIGSVRSRSVTTYTEGADAPTTETTLVVDGLTAGDTRFGVGPDGFMVLGQPAPFTHKDAQSLLDQILGPTGLSLRFVPAQTLTGGGSAAALEIVSNQPQPQFPSSTVTLRLGGASSAVSLGEQPLPLPAPGVTSNPPVAAAPAPSPSPAAEPSAGLPALADLSGTGARIDPVAAVTAAASGTGVFPALPAGPLPAASDEMAAPAPLIEPVPASGAGGASLATQPIVRPREVGSSRLLYGIVGGAAAVMLLLGGAVTRRGGAAAWLDA